MRCNGLSEQYIFITETLQLVFDRRSGKNVKIVKETAEIDDSSTEFVLLSFDHRGGGTAPTQRAAELHVRLFDLKRCVAARPQVPSKIKVNEVQSCCSLAFNASQLTQLHLNF